MRLFNFLVSFFLFTALSAAWPWPPTQENVDGALVKRQNDRETKSSSNDKTTAEPASTTEAKTASETGKKTAKATKSVKQTGDKSDKSDASETGTQTGKDASETDTQTGKKSKGKASKTTDEDSKTTSSINPAGAQGGISMITPVQTSSTYIKIGDEITFVWNYTDLAVTPTRIDVVASNTDGAWTIKGNMTYHKTGSVVWNTSDEATPLPMESYTFVVYDSEEGPTGAPKAGHLSPYNNYQFAMYSPRDPEGTGNYFCVTCSGGITAAERQSLSVLMLVATITVLSFTWFASGFLGV